MAQYGQRGPTYGLQGQQYGSRPLGFSPPSRQFAGGVLRAAASTVGVPMVPQKITYSSFWHWFWQFEYVTPGVLLGPGHWVRLSLPHSSPPPFDPAHDRSTRAAMHWPVAPTVELSASS
jgi:hypothetical protein